MALRCPLFVFLQSKRTYMYRIWKYITKNKNQFFVTALFISTIAIIVAAFPVERKFMFEFQKNKPWMHETLYAPFDFPIHKTKQELSAEKDSVIGGFKDYYSTSEQTSNVQLSAFRKQFETLFAEDKTRSAKKRNKALAAAIQTEEKMLKLFSDGIIIDRISNDKNSATATIILLSNKFAEERKLSDIRSLSSAQDLLLKYVDSLSAQYGSDAVILLKKIPVQDFLVPNIIYDQERSGLIRSGLIANISQTYGLVQKGEKIIASGDIVRNEEFALLQSLRQEYETTHLEDSDFYSILLGQTILVLVSVSVLVLFIFYAQPKILSSYRHSGFILIMVLLFVLLASLTMRFPRLSLYLLPYAMLPIIVKTFFNARIALFIYVITILIIGFIAPNSFEFVFTQIIVGAVSLYALGDTYKRSYLFLSAFISFVSYSIIFLGIGILQEADFSHIDWQMFLWFGASSLLILTAQPLIYLFEKAFGFLSDATLMELSDTNHPLLRLLSEQAPGTFQHSLQVANLSEAAAKKIGANALLVRVGCLYHDIGKALNPAYFTENQHKGTNPHDALSTEESAKIIIDHIVEGEKMARKNNLPEPIIGIITGHHGGSKVNYFLRTAKNNNPDIVINETAYEYPYPAPRSREQTIVMMADAIEAASRSLAEPSEQALKQLIDKMVDFQISEGQFRNSEVSFRNIEEIKESFLSRLVNMYHVRIAYPDVKTKSSDKA